MTDARGSWRVRILVVAVALGVAAGVVLPFLLGGDRTDVAAGTAAGAAPACRVEAFPSQGAGHERLPGFEYNSFPPTSGPAWQDPAPFGLYDEPLDQQRVLHDLMHGGVAAQYGAAVPASVVAQIEGWYASDRRGMIVAPLPALGGRIALTAWTHAAFCTRFDEQAFNGFRDAYRYQGPERLSPASLDPPGTPLRRLLGEIGVMRSGRDVTLVVQAGEALVIHAAAIEDESGRRVRLLAEAEQVEAGGVELSWDGTDDAGRPVPAGSYVVRIDAVSTTGDLTQSAAGTIVMP